MKEQRKGLLRRRVHDKDLREGWNSKGSGGKTADELSWETGTGQVSTGLGTDCPREVRTNKGTLTGFNSRML